MLKRTQRELAPDFPIQLDWVNIDQSMPLSQLRGKVLLLNFWSHCCINCQHILPKLAELERKYAGHVVVIGVHSTKYADACATDSVAHAIQRHDIQYPVVNDHQFKLWKQFTIEAWPTLVLIDPEGYIIDTQSGENALESLDRQIAALIDKSSTSANLKTGMVVHPLSAIVPCISPLSFPSKVLVDDQSSRLFISDSNNHRIIIAHRDSGEVQQVIGSGGKGLSDGRYYEARFNYPQGLELVGDLLYVADTRNHALRMVNLAKGTVQTVAGTGDQGTHGHGDGNALDSPLASPWDVSWNGTRLYIAMAGAHQLWYYDPAAERVGVWIGDGQEDLVDGALQKASLAQPSGLVSDRNGRIYFVDSETSSIRTTDLNSDGLVKTVLGHGLFEFGDVDGEYTDARLQHPLGLAHHYGKLFVADTINNKIKAVDPIRRTSFTLAGSGKRGYKDGPAIVAEFNEPSGLAVAANGKVFIADTNNHAIRVIDPQTNQVSTFPISGLDD